MKLRPVFMFVFLLSAGLLFFYKSSLYLDPDLGWHLRTGQYIFEHGFPHSDPFSYTMSTFPFVAHSWLSEIIFIRLYDTWAIQGLNLLMSFVALMIVPITLGLTWRTWTLIPALLLVTHLLPYVGTRPQTFSWLFFAIIVRLCWDKKLWSKYGRWVPAIFLLWAQVHGAWALGLVMLGIWIVVEKRTRQNFFKDIHILSASIVATLINPYGFALWKEVGSTFFSPSVRLGVNEWEPVLAQLDPRLLLVVAISFVLFIRFRAHFSGFEQVGFITVTLGMLTANKLFPFWLINAIFVTHKGLHIFWQELEGKPAARERFQKVLMAVGMAVVINSLILVWATITTYTQLAEDTYYPKKAVVYLKNTQPEGNIFAPFGWGGYLLWKLPEKRVFIDGRMPYWENILREYHDMITLQKPFSHTAISYNISMVLVQKNKTNFSKFGADLQKKGWKRIYEDEVTIVLHGP